MSREALKQRIVALIDGLADGGRDEAGRDGVLRALLQHQRSTVAPYANLCRQRGDDGAQDSDAELGPALPTDVFRFTRVAGHPAEQDVALFRTSGTSSGARGAHPLRELGLYDRAARAAASYALFCDRPRMRLLILAPTAQAQPDSSLSYMLSRFVDWFGSEGSGHFMEGDALRLEALDGALRAAQRDGEPVALLGTSFAFVHAHDGLEGRRYRLPEGSRAMQTGGFKGRSRELQPAAMGAMIGADYGLPESHVIAEYGMTELSSQLYEGSLREALTGAPGGERRLWVPGWVRTTVVDAASLEPVADGEEGLLRIDDAANLDSVAAIQTSDRAVVVGDGVRVLGRARGALARGCSIAVDQALGGDDV